MPKPKTTNQEQVKRPVVKLMHPSYQPSKAELEADMSIDASPEEVAKAVLRRVDIEYVMPPKRRKSGKE